MNVAGVASVAGTSVSIPTHQPGDIIICTARGTLNPTAPSAGGTVPNWLNIQAAVANALGLRSAYAIATTSTHTTGVWTNATDLCVIVLRPDSGKELKLGASTVGNANTTQTMIYPALTMQRVDSASWVIRVGTRGVAATTVGTAPTNYTNQIIQPAGAGALMSVHTRAGVVANPTADTVSTPGTNAAYRCHSIEIIESMIPVNPQAPVVDNFNRADQKPPGSLWAGSYNANGFQVVSNQLRQPAGVGSWDEMLWNGTSMLDQETGFTFAALGTSGTALELWVRASSPTVKYLIELGRGTPDWCSIYRSLSGNTLLGNVSITWQIGDRVIAEAQGNYIRVWRKTVAGSWSMIIERVDTLITAPGVAGLSTSDPVVIIDDFVYGPASAPLSISQVVSVV